MQFALALLVAGTAGARDAPPATPTFLKMDMIRLTPVRYAMRTEHYRHHTTSFSSHPHPFFPPLLNK